MGFLKKLFGKSDPPSTVMPIEKDKVPVYPKIKNARWPGIPDVVHVPFVKREDELDLAIIFAQDAGELFLYLTPQDLENEAVKANYEKWQRNIDAYPFDMELPERLDGRILFASGDDHSSEKILSPAFLAEACQTLDTDQLIISIPRRRCLMITSYHENYNKLEAFFYLHFVAYREEDYGNEVITDMVFVADKEKVRFAVPLGFSINVVEKDGETQLVYATMDQIFDENHQINFQQIIEKKKVPVSY